MSQDQEETILITENLCDERLDKILTKYFESRYSRTYFQYLIESGLVLLNGSPAKKRVKPTVGDEIDVQFAATPDIELKAENIPLEILYEDAYFLAINKPAGMVVHPAPGHWSGTFVNALLYHCKELNLEENDSIRPGIVHRLDKETSGVLIAAKTLEMQKNLLELFSSRKIHKEYLAICVGCPPPGEIKAPIGRHPVLRKQMAIVPNGREAISIVYPQKWNEKLALVKVIILTGRTHQIRVHLHSRRHPVLGDSIYGSESVNQHYQAKRHLLHASKISFQHPVTGVEVTLAAPVPADFQRFVNLIG